MFKINDVVVIYRSYVHEEDLPYSSYRDGDVCIIRRVFEGGTDLWLGRNESENYEVLNERTGETINLPHYVWLKPYNELYEGSYVRKSESELAESRKQAFLEWIEREKQDIYESDLFSTKNGSIVASYIEDIKELEQGYDEGKYTNRYFNTEITKLIRDMEKYKDDMNNVQIDYYENLYNKYIG